MKDLRGLVRGVLHRWFHLRGEDLTAVALDGLVQRLMETLDDWASEVETEHRTLTHDLREVIRDYAAKPELGFLTIKTLMRR